MIHEEPTCPIPKTKQPISVMHDKYILVLGKILYQGSSISQAEMEVHAITNLCKFEFKTQRFHVNPEHIF